MTAKRLAVQRAAAGYLVKGRGHGVNEKGRERERPCNTLTSVKHVHTSGEVVLAIFCDGKLLK